MDIKILDPVNELPPEVRPRAASEETNNIFEALKGLKSGQFLPLQLPDSKTASNLAQRIRKNSRFNGYKIKKVAEFVYIGTSKEE